MRMVGRFVWSKEAPNHINPGASEFGAGRLSRFVAKCSLTSKQFEGYRATIFARSTAWSAGARRRESSEPKLFACSGDPFGIINAHAPSYDQLSGRTWWPASEEEWIAPKPYGYWDTVDAGLTAEAWAGFPKLSVNKLQPRHVPLGDTELVIKFPSFVASRTLIRGFAKAGGPPSPPPADPESTSLPGAMPANYTYQGERDGGSQKRECSALQVLTGAAMASSFQGYELFICKRSKGAPNKGGLSGGPRGGLGLVEHQTKGRKSLPFCTRSLFWEATDVASV